MKTEAHRPSTPLPMDRTKREALLLSPPSKGTEADGGGVLLVRFGVPSASARSSVFQSQCSWSRRRRRTTSTLGLRTGRRSGAVCFQFPFGSSKGMKHLTSRPHCSRRALNLLRCCRLVPERRKCAFVCSLWLQVIDGNTLSITFHIIHRPNNELNSIFYED